MATYVDPSRLDQEGLVQLPLMEAKGSAGSGRVAETEEAQGFVAFTREYLRSIGVSPKFARLLEVAGSSMAPTLTDGSFVIVDTSIDRVHDDAIYCVAYSGELRFKRVQLMFDGSVLLQSDNADAGYKDERIDAGQLGELHIVGRVHGHLRDLR